MRYTVDPSHGFTMTTCRTGATISDDCDGMCLYMHTQHGSCQVVSFYSFIEILTLARTAIIQSNGMMIDLTPLSLPKDNSYYDTKDGSLVWRDHGRRLRYFKRQSPEPPAHS